MWSNGFGKESKDSSQYKHIFSAGFHFQKSSATGGKSLKVKLWDSKCEDSSGFDSKLSGQFPTKQMNPACEFQDQGDNVKKEYY
jgi:hypothetical protein